MKRVQAEAAAELDAFLPSPRLRRTGLFAILAHAFSGKLVPQDPTDEPAEELWERIRNGEPRMPRMPRIK